jgi:RNA polymerase sporulation-specific sigma factor
MQLSDNELVRLIKEKDGAALQELCQRYAPLIMTIKRHYYLRNFDDDDWDQEAMLVCYETARLFDPHKNSRFSSFYKMRLTNHARSLLRYEYAQRRAPYAQAASYEHVLAAGLVQEASYHPAELTSLPARYHEYLVGLSPRELTALRVYLQLPAQGVIYSEAQLNRACQRCKKKFKSALLPGS